jgi:ppGpp synthetase/RelA/SpoT-type nucleotidyltranferase
VDKIDQFIGQYTREYDFYEQAARLAARIIEANLQAAGIRSIVTARAKSIISLEAKCRQREGRRDGGYKSVAEITDDIVDLAGVRVALYFPGERNQVDGLITRLFSLVSPRKDFPDDSVRVWPTRFPGYSASHYRVQLREDDLSDSEKRYAVAKIEVQVASVLMHAWSEVEHDLAYKPSAGDLSDQEYAILDQINGLVIAGEIGLETLQKAGEARVASSGRSFANHYDLASYLLDQATSITDKPISEAGLGRIDLLFGLITTLKMATPELLTPYLEALHDNFEVRPLAEQIVDALLLEDPERYDLYRSIRAQRPWATVRTDSVSDDPYRQFGLFIAKWTELERLLRGTIKSKKPGGLVIPFGRDLASQNLLTEDLAREFDRLRRMRNELVHGVEPPGGAELEYAIRRIDLIIEEIRRRLNPDV